MRIRDAGSPRIRKYIHAYGVSIWYNEILVLFLFLVREIYMLYYEKKEDQTGYPRLRDLVVERQLKNESRM